MAPTDALESLVAAECSGPVAASVAAIAEVARDRFGAGVCAVLFYGSCLRQGEDENKIVDLYVLVDDYRSVHSRWWARWLNRALPPNVYYMETPFEGRQVAAKVALMSADDFMRGADGTWFHSYIWARFAQPCRLAYCPDETLRQGLIGKLAAAVRVMTREVLPPNAGGVHRARSLGAGPAGNLCLGIKVGKNPAGRWRSFGPSKSAMKPSRPWQRAWRFQIAAP